MNPQWILAVEPAAPSGFEAGTLSGMLHLFVAFDWGEEVDLQKGRELVPSTPHEFPRRSRTPGSIAYRSPPLRCELSPLEFDLPELGPIAATANAMVFDFGAVSLSLRAPWQLSPGRLRIAAAGLAETDTFLPSARKILEPLYTKLLPAIIAPEWADLSEEYVVLQIEPAGPESRPESLLATQGAWLASLLRLEASPLSRGEIAEALRLRLSYTDDDLVLVDWAAAVIVDKDCDEILEALAFANLQLLEFRHIDSRLDARLATTYGLTQRIARQGLPFWRSHTRQLRDLGQLNAEVNEMLDRATSAFTLVGDPYLARVYQLLVSRLHLDEWGRNVRQSIEVLERIYQVLSDQAATYRAEVLEIAIVLLIVIEIVLALVRH